MSKKALKIKVKKLDKRKLHKKLLISLGVKPRKGIIIICKNCGKENYRRQSHSQRVFCSKKCYGEFQKSGIYHKCKTCGKIYYRNKGQVKHRGETKYCSKQYKGQDWIKMIKKESKKKIIKPSKLKKKLWVVFAKYIKKRDKNICFTCGRYCEGYNAHAGHFIAKSVGGLILYFNEDNVHCQCFNCNINLGGNSYIYGKKLGKDKCDELYKLKEIIIKDFPYEEMIKKYETLNQKT